MNQIFSSPEKSTRVGFNLKIVALREIFFYIFLRQAEFVIVYISKILEHGNYQIVNF